MTEIEDIIPDAAQPPNPTAADDLTLPSPFNPDSAVTNDTAEDAGVMIASQISELEESQLDFNSQSQNLTDAPIDAPINALNNETYIIEPDTFDSMNDSHIEEPDIAMADTSDETTISASAIAGAAATAAPPKPPRTGYMLFNKEIRTKQTFTGPVAEQARAISALWGALTEAEKKEYSERVLKLREDYDAYLKANPEYAAKINAHKKDGSSSSNDESHLQFPLGRIRKMIENDKDIKRCSKEASILITRASEQFVLYMANHLSERAESERRKTIQAKDISGVVHTYRRYTFLRHVFDKKSGETRQPTTTAATKRKKSVPNSTASNSAGAQHSITNFFKS